MARAPRLQAALKALANPYACLQYEDEEPDLVMQSARERLRRSENPYAQLDYEDRKLSKVAARDESSPVIALSPESALELSATEFEQNARAIFRQYIPAEERGRLREHHRTFIERNRRRSPRMRQTLIRHLRRYDLSDIRGFMAQFNREEDQFTNEKLLEIERRALRDDDGQTK